MAMPEGPDPHRAWEEMAVGHVLGGLDPDAGRRFRSHLLECGDCRASVGELRAIAHELDGVERDEQRDRAAQAVELAQREVEEDPERELDDRRWRRVRIWGAIGVLLLVLLGAYAFTLRQSYQRLSVGYEERLEATAALEHGADLPILQAADGLIVTARRSDDRVALLVEGLDDTQTYGLYLTRDDGDRQITVNRTLQSSQDGRMFVTARLDGQEEELHVTRVESGFPTAPTGRILLQATVPAAPAQLPSG